MVCRWGAERLPFPDNSFELVYVAHVLEHVPWYQTIAALREAERVLIPGGTLELHVPDFDVLVQAARNRCYFDDHTEENLNEEMHWMHWVAERLFHLGEEHQWHKACFNAYHLTWCLEQAGFTEITGIESERGLSHGVIDLGMTAIKPTGAVQKSFSGALGPMAHEDDRPEEKPGVAEGLPYCHSRQDYDKQAKTFFCASQRPHGRQSRND